MDTACLKRSFKVLLALDPNQSDASNLLKDTRLEIDADKGRVSQAGTRAGSQLFRALKCSGAAKAPCTVYVLLQETTRGSAKKEFG